MRMGGKAGIVAMHVSGWRRRNKDRFQKNNHDQFSGMQASISPCYDIFVREERNSAAGVLRASANHEISGLSDRSLAGDAGALHNETLAGVQVWRNPLLKR